MHNLQIPETAESKLFPNGSSHRFPDKDRFTSSRPDFVLVTSIAAKIQKQQTNVGGFFEVAGGN